jgi:uncharacterized protein (UPF0147 family)
MNWLHHIEIEQKRISPNEPPGRTRTIARRIAGIALQQYYHVQATDFMKLLHTAVNDDAVPQEIRAAVERLSARLDANFSSPSLDPIADAQSVVEFVRRHTP